jgi:hypothetical protein
MFPSSATVPADTLPRNVAVPLKTAVEHWCVTRSATASFYDQQGSGSVGTYFI